MCCPSFDGWVSCWDVQAFTSELSLSSPGMNHDRELNKEAVPFTGRQQDVSFDATPPNTASGGRNGRRESVQGAVGGMEIGVLGTITEARLSFPSPRRVHDAPLYPWTRTSLNLVSREDLVVVFAGGAPVCRA
ncbi:unnamed protein product [Arctogadus glacialis]